MVKIMSYGLMRGKVAKIILLVLVLFILILTTSSQNVLAEETRRVNASEILVNISRGEPVEVTNRVIIGDLDVSEIRDNLTEIEIEGKERRIVESPIKIRHSIIQGDVNFNPIYFNNTVKFINVTFNGRASFIYAVFNKQPDFQESTFKEEADFWHATFNKGAFFERAKIKSASFNNASFNKSAFFDFTTFDGLTTFRNAIFVEEAKFYASNFNDLTTFRNATFNNLAFFQLATFNGVVIFKNATFNGYANFIRATFNKAEADFEFAKFMQTVNFYHTEFNSEAHFQNARFNDTTYFSLAKFKDRAYFTDASFNDTVDFSEADIFLTMKINWSQLEGKLVYNGYFYQVLIRNFETLGQSEDANDAYYKYKVEKRKHMPIFGLRRPLEFIFLDLSCGYGVKPLRPIEWAGIIIGLFSIFYWRIEDKENKKSKSDSSLKDRILKFVFLSVSIFTTLGYWNKWKPAKNHETKFRIGAIIEALLGWIIMTLFVISLTMTWIR